MHDTSSSQILQTGASPDEARLVRRAQGGDHAAFGELAQRYRPLLLALAFLRTGSREEAQDLVQDVLTNSWRRLNTLQDPSAFLPWVRAIAANACNSWYRRSRPSPASLDEGDEHQLPASRLPMPLDLVLAGETQRELRRALLAIPDANRIALLMHVWDGASYEDIAAFTGVRLTTVEGRIYRAKRQLCRILSDDGAAFLGAPRRKYKEKNENQENALTHVALSPRRKPMKQMKLPEPTKHTLTQPFLLAQFSHSFSVMVDSGVSLMRILNVLQDLEGQYGEACKALEASVGTGATLSDAMLQRPDLFSNVYLGLIRAGEVGGILEETLQQAARLTMKEWRLAKRRPGNEEPLLLINPSNQAPREDWTELSEYQQAMTLIMFCETFGMLLQSRVPIKQTLLTLADLLPAKQVPALMEAVEAINAGDTIVPALRSMEILPRFAIEMFLVGEVSGAVDTMLYRIAEILEWELEDRMAGA